MVDIHSVAYWAVLAFAGASCGFLNTLASSGSAVSLPILVMLGMPEGVANATNRLPVLIGSSVAVFTFWREGKVDWAPAFKLSLPAVLGAAIGTVIAEWLPDQQLGYLLTGAVLLALVLLFTKARQALQKEITEPASVSPFALVLMFFVGVWLGLIVIDGATFILLVLILVCSYAFPQANAIKAVIMTLTGLVSVAMFWSGGEVRVAEGGFMSIGAILGAYFGAKLSSHAKSRKWAFNLLVLTISLELLQLIWRYTAPLRLAP